MEHETNHPKTYIAILSIAIASLLIITSAHGEPRVPPGTSQSKLINGMAIYIGVIPAEMLQGHLANKMHGGVPLGHIRFHLTVAIFNDKSGERLNNAQVTAQIFTIPEKTGFKELEPMEFGKTLVYGNYFSLESLGPYLIQLHIEHKTLSNPIDVEFQYQAAYAKYSK